MHASTHYAHLVVHPPNRYIRMNEVKDNSIALLIYRPRINVMNIVVSFAKLCWHRECALLQIALKTYRSAAIRCTMLKTECK